MRTEGKAVLLAALVVLVTVGFIINRRIDLSRARDESLQCVSNLKQLNLLARFNIGQPTEQGTWALKELVLGAKASPTLMFCPSGPDYTKVSNMTWAGFDDELEPSYCAHFENEYDEMAPGEVILECPIHGHKALMDGGVETPKESKNLVPTLF